MKGAAIMDAVHEETRHGLTIKIVREENAENPREWDNAGTMVCWHRCYTLGDENASKQYEGPESFLGWWKDNGKGGALLPLFLYDHGGITMRTGAFSCPWDSGQVGFIYMTAGIMRVEQMTKKKALACLEGEVKTYDDYLTGNVYGYQIEDTNGEQIESCYGFFGDYDNKDYGALSEARAIVDRLTHKGTTDEKGQYLMPFLTAA
jgi:hypothetical protein